MVLTEKSVMKQTKRSWEQSCDLISLAEKWYPEANSFCSNLAKEYELTDFQVSSICAALSPMKSWEENKKLTINFLKGKRNGHFSNQIKKAKKILNTSNDLEPINILNGLKTVSFYRNIYNPSDNNYVTIDRHLSKIYNNGNLLRITPARYNLFANSLKKLAKDVNLPVTTIQSALWLHAKREWGNNI